MATSSENSLEVPQQGVNPPPSLRICVLGASETSNPWGKTWIGHIQAAIASEGLDIEIIATGSAGQTCYQALNHVDPYSGKTPAQITSEFNPDIIIEELGINDAITKQDQRTLSQILQDVADLYDFFRTNNPNVIIIRSRLIPYDEERHGGLPVTAIKKKFCGPWMHGQIDEGGTNYYSSEPSFLNSLLSEAMQDRLGEWKSYDSDAQALADYVINTSYFRPTRFGLTTSDRSHFTELGHYWTAAKVWRFFQTELSLKAQFPLLAEIRDVGEFPDFDDVWRSAVKLDVYGDGYDFDPDFLDGKEFAYWEGFFGLDLVNSFRFWSNSRRPNIGYTTVIQIQNGDIFSIFATGLWPSQEVKTKLWAATAPEPPSYSPFSIPRLTSETGDYINITTNVSGFTPGTWNLKFAVGENAYGIFPITMA
jgi:lysophospholipase L1-like esterase